MRSSQYVHLQALPRNSPRMSGQRDDPKLNRLPDVGHHDECPNSFLGTQEDDRQNSPPRTLLTRPVLRSVANHASFAFPDICVWILLPLVYTTPIRLGGLGLDPTPMGTTLAVYGIMKGILQLTVFDRIDSLGSVAHSSLSSPFSSLLSSSFRSLASAPNTQKGISSSGSLCSSGYYVQSA